MTNEPRKLIGGLFGVPRKPNGEIDEDQLDEFSEFVAATLQRMIEEDEQRDSAAPADEPS